MSTLSTVGAEDWNISDFFSVPDAHITCLICEFSKVLFLPKVKGF